MNQQPSASIAPVLNDREVLKSVVILKEMYDNGAITMMEALISAVQEGLKIAQCVHKEQEYKCEFTY